MVRAATVIALLISTPATAQFNLRKQVDAMIARPATELEPLIAVKGDELDPSYEVSSQGVTAITYKGLLASNTVEQTFLRAFVTKKTGAVSVQIYFAPRYTGNGWKHFNRASVEAPEGAIQPELTRIGSDVSCSGYRYGGCTYYEDVAIELPIEVLRAAVRAYVPGSATGLHFRVYGQDGSQMDDVLPGNELIAFLTVLDRTSARIVRR